MKKWIKNGLAVLLFVALAGSQGGAAVEAEFQRTLKLQDAPLDLTVSLNGKWIFVLTAAARVQVYTPDGRLEGEFAVGNQVDGIRVGPREDLLLLTSRKDQTVQIVTLDFIRPVDVSGSPFKGRADAPVVIAVFSDFE